MINIFDHVWANFFTQMFSLISNTNTKLNVKTDLFQTIQFSQSA